MNMSLWLKNSIKNGFVDCCQFQITTYSHKDENNMWRLKQALEEPDIELPPVVIRNGDLVRLEHIT